MKYPNSRIMYEFSFDSGNTLSESVEYKVNYLDFQDLKNKLVNRAESFLKNLEKGKKFCSLSGNRINPDKVEYVITNFYYVKYEDYNGTPLESITKKL